MSNTSPYSTTPDQLRQPAEEPAFPFEDLERELECEYVPSADYLRSIQSAQVDIADWLTTTRVHVGGPLYQRVSRLRVGLRRRHDQVSRAVDGATLGEMAAQLSERMLNAMQDAQSDADPAESAALLEAV
jgi:hypothetical protein